MIEPFFINPFVMRGGPKRKRRRGTVPGRVIVDQRIGRRRNPFGESVMIVGSNPRGLPRKLLSRAMKRYGPERGMEMAWREYKGKSRIRTRRRNPFGEEVSMMEGLESFLLNPRRRRRKAVRRRKRRGLASLLAPRRRRRRKTVAVRRRRRRAVAAAPRRRRRRRAVAITTRRRRRRRPRARVVRRRRRSGLPALDTIGGFGMANPRRRRRRRFFLDNPAAMSLDWRRPMSLLMPVAVGTGAFFITDRAPAMFGIVGQLPVYGVKAAVGIGGGMLVGRFLGRQSGAIWMLGSFINLASDIVKQYILRTTVAGLGYGAFPYQEVPSPQYSGYDGGGYGAYPEEMVYPY